MHNFQALFYPQAIAVIGASRNPQTVGNDVVKNLLQGYQGKLFLVNPKADDILGKSVHHSIAEIPEDFELGIFAIPAQFIPQSLLESAQKGMKAAIIISAGFKEAGNAALEQEVQKICQEHNITLIGPNCLGILNPEHQMNASFAATMPAAGEIAFISQSGALCTAILDYAKELNIGFSKFLSIGNKAVIDEKALLEYFLTDQKTKVILMYAEQLSDAQAIIQMTKQLTQAGKPIIILKSGKTSEGASAVASHTGSLSGGDNAYQALFTQAGIIRAQSIQELFDFAQVFTQNPMAKSQQVAIITNAGGPGVLTTDDIISQGLQLAPLSQETQTQLQAVLPAAANTHNPIDVLGDAPAERYRQALEMALKDSQVDAAIVVLTPQSMTQITETAQAVIELKATYHKPIIVSFMGAALVKPGVEALRQAGITTLSFPDRAGRSLQQLSGFASSMAQPSNPVTALPIPNKAVLSDAFAQAKQVKQTSFPEAQAIELLHAYGFPTLASQVVSSPEQALAVATQIGKPLAMKIVSQDILHKSDVGGVALHVTTANIVEKYNQMMVTVKQHKPDAKIEGVLLVEMAPQDGVETILGVTKQPGLGHLLMFGLGGIFVEVLKDVSFGFAPLCAEDAERMVETLKSKKLFEGVRGTQPIDKQALKETILRLSQLVTDFPEIKELDMNPLLALPQGNLVLDARIIIEE